MITRTALAAVGLAAVLAGCNTMEGLGRDVERGGVALQDQSSRTQAQMSESSRSAEARASAREDRGAAGRPAPYAYHGPNTDPMSFSRYPSFTSDATTEPGTQPNFIPY